MSQIVNPFSSVAIPLGIPNAYTKITGITVDPIVAVPNYGTYVATVNTQNLSAAITGLQTIQNLYSNGQILTFNTQETLAIQNTLTLLQASSVPTINLSTGNVSDLVIAVQAIKNIQNTGVLIQQADLTNANIQVVSANTGWFPDGATTIVCNDQYMIAEQPGTGSFYWSNSANAMDWSVLNTADMESYSDQPLAMDQFSGQVVAFGVQSIEFFTDTGQFPIPYVAVPQTTQNYGIAAVFSRAPFMNSIAFLGQNRTGQAHVFVFSGYTPVPISTSDIDDVINGFSVINDAFGYSYDSNGHQFYQITFPSARRSFLYDGTTQLWSEVMSGVYSPYNRHLTSLAVTFNSTTLAGDAATGNVYILDPNAVTDNGFLIRREVTSMHVNMDGNMFSVGQLWLDVEVGAGTQSGLAQNPMIELYISKDEGNTYKGPFLKSLGKIGQYKKRVLWRRLGASRDFVFRFVITDPVPVNIIRGLAVVKKGT